MKLLSLAGLAPSEEERASLWSKLPEDERQDLTAWRAAFEAVAEMGLPNGPALAAVAERMHVSWATARRMYDWARRGKKVPGRARVFGWQAWVDLRKATVFEEPGVPSATIQWWRQMRDQFKGRANCMRQAYQRCIAVWSLTEDAIPGYPERPPADGEHSYPAGWSYGNFCRLVREEEMVKAAAMTGMRAALNYGFHVPQTRVGLECGQYIVIDDVWHDFKVKAGLRAPAGRLLELCALDLFSAKKVCYGLKCETTDDETGIRQRLQERDMRFLLAALLSCHGYRRTGATLICEAGTAVVREEIARALFDATGGAIQVETGQCRSSPAFPGWYRGQGRGNPRLKASLESRFNLDHNAEAMLPGQVSPNERVSAPEELHGRGQADVALVKAVKGLELAPAKLDMLRWPFLLLHQASELIAQIYAWLDGRTEHELEGWEAAGLIIGQVRVDPRSPHWVPLYALPRGTPEQIAAVEALTKLPGCFSLRKMSPAEVWTDAAANLARLPMSILPQIIGGDLAQERALNDHGAFLFDDPAISPAPLRYVGIAVNIEGRQILLEHGEKYLTFCNPFDARYLLVCDARGRYIGRCERVNPVCRADAEDLHRAMGLAARVDEGRLRAFVARNAGHAAAKAEDEAANAALLAGALPAPDPAKKRKAQTEAEKELEAIAAAAIEANYRPAFAGPMAGKPAPA